MSIGMDAGYWRGRAAAADGYVQVEVESQYLFPIFCSSLLSGEAAAKRFDEIMGIKHNEVILEKN